jgi:polar amino acid transport system permease protein
MSTEAIVLFLQRVTPELMQGTGVTIQFTIGGLALGFFIGLPVALARVYGFGWLQRIVSAYVTLFRGTPMLIQLFLIYYGLPDWGLTFDRPTAALLALGLNSGAYQAEYFRGAIQAVGQGQMTAARAIGMNQWKAIRFIVLPQAFRLAIPAWSNEMIAMVKYTSVIFLIAVPDLMAQAKILSSRYFDPITIYITVAIYYLVLVGLATLLVRFVAKKLETPGLKLDVELR